MSDGSLVTIALDIGGTKSMVASLDERGTIISREKVPTPYELSEGLHTLKNLVRMVAGTARIRAIGASAGGPLDYAQGVVSPLHMPTWRAVPLKEIFEREFGCPFFVDVDTNAAALAEYVFAKRPSDRLLYITISTGVGGGFIVDGKIYRGARGSHPEIGHQIIPNLSDDSVDVRCPCGATGCLEALISGTAVRKRFGKNAEELNDDEWSEIASYLADGLRNIVVMYAPSEIVLGGGMALGGGERLLNRLKQRLNKQLLIIACPDIRFSTLGYDTALLGAYTLTLDETRLE
jgi:glucokinase